MIEDGRETDALVARVVFGWRPLYAQDKRVRELWPPTVDPFSPKPDWSQCAEPPDWGIVPYYSTSISDAWRIVTKMSARMESDADFTWEGPLYKPTHRESDDALFPPGASCWYVSFQTRGVEERRIVCAATAPLAVCIAALQIIEDEENINRDLNFVRTD